MLALTCPDGPGILHAVTGVLADLGGNISDSQQSGDPGTSRFHLRVQVVLPPGTERDAVAAAFTPVAERFAMRWTLDVAGRLVRTLVMVSRAGHCLNDLLFRQRAGLLPIEVPVIVGNHRDLEPLATSYGVPFHHLPVTDGTRGAAEAGLLDLVTDLDVELVVLARCMQVLSAGLCERLEGRAITIHHSFLPSFRGARPCAQAHERGVKLIGATAHYVAAGLDEGPIIEQGVERVSHAQDVAELQAIGAVGGGVGARPGGALARRAPGAPRRAPHRRLRLSPRRTPPWTHGEGLRARPAPPGWRTGSARCGRASRAWPARSPGAARPS